MVNYSITLVAPTNTITIESNLEPSQYVNEDQKFRFDGAGGDTYLKYNSSTHQVELYVDGTIRAAWSA